MRPYTIVFITSCKDRINKLIDASISKYIKLIKQFRLTCGKIIIIQSYLMEKTKCDENQIMDYCIRISKYYIDYISWIIL